MYVDIDLPQDDAPLPVSSKKKKHFSKIFFALLIILVIILFFTSKKNTQYQQLRSNQEQIKQENAKLRGEPIDLVLPRS